MPALSTPDLKRLIEQSRAVANICERHAELDGRERKLG